MADRIRIHKFVNLKDEKTLYDTYKDLKLYISKHPNIQNSLPNLDNAYNTIIKNPEYNYDDVIHSLRVACVCAKEMKLDLTSITAAILHQIPEKNKYYKKVLTPFGKHVSNIVIGVQNIKNINNHKNITEIILKFINDIRIFFVRIAEKLIVMRKLNNIIFDNKDKYRIITEVKYIYMPISHRLGLDKINLELGDLCLKYSCPNIYYRIASKIGLKKDAREKILDNFSKNITDNIKQNNVLFKIKKRTKSIASIWSKIKKRKMPLKDIYDLSAIRIILDLDFSSIYEESKACWEIFNIIKDTYELKNNRIRDWLSKPKGNGYEALHLTVTDKEGFWTEVQIRTKRMNDKAERGVAAHWKYKNDHIAKQKIPNIHEWMDSIKTIVDNDIFFDINDNSPSLSLYTDKICVRTSKKLIKKPIYFNNRKNQNLVSPINVNSKEKLVILPIGSILLDYMKQVYLNEKIHVLYGKVNNKVAPWSQILHNGDFIEILFNY